MNLKNKIDTLKLQNFSYNKIAETLGCDKSTVSYYLNGFGNDHVRRRMAITRQKNRKKFITQLKLTAGGRCLKCGYSKCLEALEFHHKNPKDKQESVSRLSHNLGNKRALIEAQKCVLICGNCHAELHAGLWRISDLNVQNGQRGELRSPGLADPNDALYQAELHAD